MLNRIGRQIYCDSGARLITILAQTTVIEEGEGNDWDFMEKPKVDNELSESLQVYPNPAKTHITFGFEFGLLPQNTPYYIYNSLGELVFSNTLVANQKQLELSIEELKAGLYLFKMNNNFVKFVKE